MDIWKDNAKSYSKSFKEPLLEEIRELAYLQGAMDFKQEYFKKFQNILYPEAPSMREGFYEKGYREGVTAVLQLLKEK